MSQEPPYSPNLETALAAATAEARRRNHPVLCTEHVLWAFLHTPTVRVIPWMFEQSGDPNFVEKVLQDLEARPSFQPGPATGQLAGGDNVSAALARVLKIATQIGSTPVEDGDMVHHSGIVACEFVVAAFYVEGTNLALRILAKVSRGTVNSLKLLEAINVDVNQVHALRPETEGCKWSVFRKADAPPAGVADWVPPADLPEPATFPANPLGNTHWLLPGRLLVGEDQNYASDAELRRLLDVAGVTTFVCLVGEYGSADGWRAKGYPHRLMALASAAQQPTFLHFPIRDFHAPPPDALGDLSLELERRLRRGEVLYVHCRGGHGRTGMAVLPLVASLFDESVEGARAWVQQCGQRRESDRGWPADYPETAAQLRTAVDAMQTAGKLRGR